MNETRITRMTGWIECADENWHYFTDDKNRPDTSACLIFHRPLDFDRIFKTLPPREAQRVCPVCQRLVAEAVERQRTQRILLGYRRSTAVPRKPKPKGVTR